MYGRVHEKGDRCGTVHPKWGVHWEWSWDLERDWGGYGEWLDAVDDERLPRDLDGYRVVNGDWMWAVDDEGLVHEDHFFHYAAWWVGCCPRAGTR